MSAEVAVKHQDLHYHVQVAQTSIAPLVKSYSAKTSYAITLFW